MRAAQTKPALTSLPPPVFFLALDPAFPELKRGPKPVNEHAEPERLYSEIGKLKMELDWLKKRSGVSQ